MSAKANPWQDPNYVLVHRHHGLFLAHDGTGSYWSLVGVNPATGAPTFPDSIEAEMYIRENLPHFPPEDLRFIAIETDGRKNYASYIHLVKAGLGDLCKHMLLYVDPMGTA